MLKAKIVFLICLLSIGAHAAESRVYSFDEYKSMGVDYPDRLGVYKGDFEFNFKVKGIPASVFTLYGGERDDDIYMTIIGHDRYDAREVHYAVRGDVVGDCAGESRKRPVRTTITVESKGIGVYEVCDADALVKYFTPISREDKQYVVGQYLHGSVNVEFDGVSVNFDTNGFAYVWDLLDRRTKHPGRL